MLRSMSDREVHRLTVGEGVIGKGQLHRPPLTCDRWQWRLVTEGRGHIARINVGGADGKGLGQRLKDDAWIDITEVSVGRIQAVVTAGGIAGRSCRSFRIEGNAGKRTGSPV